MKFMRPFSPRGLTLTFERYPYPLCEKPSESLIHAIPALYWYVLVFEFWILYIFFIYPIYWLSEGMIDTDNIPKLIPSLMKIFMRPKPLPDGTIPDFTIKNNVLKRYNKESEEIVIPEGVTEIFGNDFFAAFLGNTTLHSVTFPNSLEKIGNRAFNYCANLEEIKLPEKLKSISPNAFECCYNLTSVEIPSGVKKIESSAFAFCIKLETVTLSEGLQSIEENAFCCCTGLEAIEIPSTVTKIEEKAFKGCTNLKCVFFYGEADIAPDALPSNARIVKKGKNIPVKQRLSCYLAIQRAKYDVRNGTTSTATKAADGVKKVAGVAKTVVGATPVGAVANTFAGVVRRTAKEIALRNVAINMVIELAKAFGKVYNTVDAEAILDFSNDGMDSKVSGYLLSLIPLIGKALQESSDVSAMETLGWAVAEGLSDGRF